MKKGLFLLLCSIIAISTLAQGRFDFGIHGGYTNTKIKFKEKNFNINSDNGYNFGLFARVNFNRVYVESALDFVNKKSDYINGGEEQTLKYNAIDVPILLGFRLLNIPIFKIRSAVGPVMSFKTKNMKIKEGIHSMKNENLNWFLRAGAGVDLWKLSLDLNHEWGLKELGENIKAPNTWNVVLGFRIF